MTLRLVKRAGASPPRLHFASAAVMRPESRDVVPANGARDKPTATAEDVTPTFINLNRSITVAFTGS
jgi:hypothetical protein